MSGINERSLSKMEEQYEALNITTTNIEDAIQLLKDRVKPVTYVDEVQPSDTAIVGKAPDITTVLCPSALILSNTNYRLSIAWAELKTILENLQI